MGGMGLSPMWREKPQWRRKKEVNGRVYIYIAGSMNFFDDGEFPYEYLDGSS